MTSSGNNPSLQQDPALTGTLAGAFNFAIDKIIQGLDNRLPAQVIAYDRLTNLAQVQIMVPMVTTGNLGTNVGQTVVARPQPASVPVQVDGGGGLFISFPITTGDLGWIEANDRDISLFLQTYKQTAPNTFRKWTFSDGKFTPDVMHGFTINMIDDKSAVISTLDGTVRIAISKLGGVIITTPVLTVNGGLSLTGDVTGDPSGPPLIFAGNIAVTGYITAGGSITPDTPPP